METLTDQEEQFQGMNEDKRVNGEANHLGNEHFGGVVKEINEAVFR